MGLLVHRNSLRHLALVSEAETPCCSWLMQPFSLNVSYAEPKMHTVALVGGQSLGHFM